MSAHLSIDDLTQRAATLQAAGDIDGIQREFLSRSSLITEQLRTLKSADDAIRRNLAPQLQALRSSLEAWALAQSTRDTGAQKLNFDPTLPALQSPLGGVHPISAMIAEMSSIFMRLGFEVVQGTELVSDIANFADLNIGPDHPARDGHDSFYIADDALLRTQTTAAQVIEMKQRKAAGKVPIRVIVPGKTYRRESDQTHAAMFHQIDAVVVDTTTNFAELKGTLDYFVRQLFGDTVETRFRPHHFPFT
jgi:phenylalanyl-tRNA synthetase alpha chain